MKRRQADVVVGVIVAGIVAIGALLSFDAYQQRQSVDGMMDGSMMGGSMEPMYGTDPLWFVFGTVILAVTVGGVYLLFREDFTRSNRTDTPVPPSSMAADPERSAPANREPPDASGDGVAQSPGTVQPPAGAPDSAPSQPDADSQRARSPKSPDSTRLLDILPEDERRILEPVLDSPGLTQIELRDRSDFSKSKVSQTVSELEKRGLLVRERQGRTYRVYPSDELSAEE